MTASSVMSIHIGTIKVCMSGPQQSAVMRSGRYFTCADFWYYDLPPLMAIANAIMISIIVVYTTMLVHAPMELEAFDVATLPSVMNERPIQVNYVRLNSDDNRTMTLGVRSIIQYNKSYVEVRTEYDIMLHVCQSGGGCVNPGVFASVDEDDSDMRETLVTFADTSISRRQLLRIYLGRWGSKKRFYICIFCKFGGCTRNWGKTSCSRLIAFGYDVDKK